MKNSRGYVLSTLRYGDSDAIIHCFTQENGYRSFFVRGIFNPKSKTKTYLQPLSQIYFNINKTGSREMPSISKIELLDKTDFQSDVKIGSIVFFAADFLNSSLRNENENQQAYDEIGNFIDALKSKNYHAHTILLLRILKMQGLAPLSSDGEFLNLEDGNFGNTVTHKLLSTEISQLWKNLLLEKFPYAIKIDKSLRKPLLESLLLYYQVHFPGFKVPVSLEILKQIF